MKNFISNSAQARLKDRVVELISKSKELKFLVGFFYFSGIRELYEGLKKREDLVLNVLVGLNVDTAISGITEFSDKTENISDEERVYRFFTSVKNSLNTDDFDNEEFYGQVRFFIDLIKNNRLVIRKTYEPNHAKLYIFKLQEDQVGRNSLFITGSSNLTRAGLTTQQEFNVEISDYGVKDAEDYFDALWKDAVKITEDDAIRQKLIDVVETETHIKEITPFEAFLLVLQTYLDSIKHEQISHSLIELMEKNGYKPYAYQIDAAQQALAIIKEHGGVVIADVVGLGKSVIASLVAKSMNKRGLIVCPPGLIGDRNKESGWRKYCEEFGLQDWEVRSCGELEMVAEFVKNKSDIEVVIVDEAHRFRNEDTKDYELLKNICRGRIVLLLTATPFNNTPDDILSLLELFIIPKKSRITLENDLGAKFRNFRSVFDKLVFIKKHHSSSNPDKKHRAEMYYEMLFGGLPISLPRVEERAHYLSKQIRDVIEPVTIRRNRLDLLKDPEYKIEVQNLSVVKDPQEWFFELTEAQSKFYDSILSEYFCDPDLGGRFKGAIYRPFEYEMDVRKLDQRKLDKKQNTEFQQQRNLYDFMRRMLVKRFESSFGAFSQSIHNFLDVHIKVQRFIESSKGKYILDRALLEAIYDKDSEEIESKLTDYVKKLEAGNYPKNSRIYEVNKFELKDDFLKDIESDIQLLQEILAELGDLRLIEEDPKAACLVSHLKDVLREKPKTGEPKRKVLIFSEYGDTVKHLHEKYLKKAVDGRILVVEGDLPTSKIKSINRNFDASCGQQDEDFDVLLTTDKISEGFNLNRAGLIINYDIPWNPVRVIQRVGRINRISRKVFDELRIINFFPTETGSSVVRSREIAQHKMFLIHNTLGEDSKIFDVDEEPTAAALFARIQQNPEKLQEESFYTKVRRELMRISKEMPEVLERLKKCPARVKVAKAFSEDALFVFIRKGRLFARQVIPAQGVAEDVVSAITLEEVFEKISCSSDEKAVPLSDGFWERYIKAKEFREQHSTAVNENSLEAQARNNTISLMRRPWEELMPFLDFLKMLREDITDYGTLPDYTLRRLANLKMGNDVDNRQTLKEIKEIMSELGADYLDKEKLKMRDMNQQVIIAIENQKK